MNANLCATALLVCVTTGVAQQGQRGPMPRELKPHWQRLLTGDDAKQAVELEKRLNAAAMTGKRDAALRLAEEVLALRVVFQPIWHSRLER